MSVEKEDKILFCKDCGEEFIFTIREQDFYAQKGFEHDPARCTNCRAVRKRGGGGAQRFQQQGYAPSSVNYYNEPGNSNYQPRPNNYGNGNGNSYQPRPNNYGNSNRVNNYGNGNGNSYQPRPNNYGNGNRVNNYGNGNGNSYQPRPNNYGNGGRPASPYGNYRPTVTSYSPGNGGYRDYNNMQQDDRKRYPIICMSCGIETEVPFAPREGVPVFCRSCYNMQKPNHN